MLEEGKLIREEDLPYEGVRGIPHIREAGNAVRRRTGDWRIFRPEIEPERCVKCKMCFLMCPDSAVAWKDGPEIDYFVCKGCLICASVCPVKAIKVVRDEGPDRR